jgi:hypothetical protein
MNLHDLKPALDIRPTNRTVFVRKLALPAEAVRAAGIFTPEDLLLDVWPKPMIRVKVSIGNNEEWGQPAR